MSKKFISGLVLGAISGAAAALLLAPKKGEELREEIGDKTEDLKAVALDYIELLTVKGEELLNATVQSTQSLVDKFQNDEPKDKVEELAEKAQDVVEETVEKGEKVADKAVEKAQDVKEKAADKAQDVKEEVEKTADKVEEKVEKATK